MATSALIGYINGDSVRNVYCHRDGYPRWVGKCLLDGFGHQEFVVDLIERGEIRSIHPKADGSGYEVEHRVDGDPTSELPLSEFVPSGTLCEWQCASYSGYNRTSLEVYFERYYTGWEVHESLGPHYCY